MKPTKTALLALAGMAAATAQATAPMLVEEQIAREEERRIYRAPIAGIENKLWFNYLIDVTEAQKEARSDLTRASDLDDVRDAWEEYAEELREEREVYTRKMAKRGYRTGTVTID